VTNTKLLGIPQSNTTLVKTLQPALSHR